MILKKKIKVIEVARLVDLRKCENFQGKYLRSFAHDTPPEYIVWTNLGKRSNISIIIISLSLPTEAILMNENSSFLSKNTPLNDMRTYIGEKRYSGGTKFSLFPTWGS
jgi:hypothetical protein